MEDILQQYTISELNELRQKAKCLDTPSDELQYMSECKIHYVELSIVFNPNTSLNTLEFLAENSTDSLNREGAKIKINERENRLKN